MAVAGLVGALATLIGLSFVVAGFTDDYIWEGVAREAPIPFALGLVALSIVAARIVQIRRHSRWPRVSWLQLFIACAASVVGYAAWSDSLTFILTTSGCHNSLELLLPGLAGFPSLRLLERVFGLLMFTCPAFLLLRPGYPAQGQPMAA